jgi:hypothetical protein
MAKQAPRAAAKRPGLGHVPVVQTFVFIIIAHLLEIVKAQCPKYVGFSLLAALMSVNGVSLFLDLSSTCTHYVSDLYTCTALDRL